MVPVVRKLVAPLLFPTTPTTTFLFFNLTLENTNKAEGTGRTGGGNKKFHQKAQRVKPFISSSAEHAPRVVTRQVCAKRITG